MTDNAVSAQTSTCGPSIATTTELNGRQLRKSCRFCRSRKIRCSGETDIGCLACRTRSRECVYEPTAAMGRPRKYPRLESHVDSAIEGSNSNPVHPLHQAWMTSAGLMRRTLTHNNLDLASHLGPNTLGPSWQNMNNPSCNSSFSSVSPFYRTSMLALPIGSAPQHQSISPKPRTRQTSLSQLGVVLPSNHAYPLAPPPPPISTTAAQQQPGGSHPLTIEQFQVGSGDGFTIAGGGYLAQAEITQPSPSQVPSFNGSASVATPSTHSSHSQVSFCSPPRIMASASEVHNMLQSCDTCAIFKCYQGATLNKTTQAHLEFILREFPNPGLQDPTFEFPSMTEPKFYGTMFADVVSWLTSSKPSVPDCFNGIPDTGDEMSLFKEMLKSDRGSNCYDDSMAVLSLGKHCAPLDQVSPSQVEFIWFRWLSTTPFRVLLAQAVGPNGTLPPYEDPALLATIVGWYIYESSYLNLLEVASSFDDEKPSTNGLSHSWFFDYAEADLMQRPTTLDGRTPSTIQALILLGLFRTSDSQPRCGWAMLSTAHVLARESVLQGINGAHERGIKRQLRDDSEGYDRRILGPYWFLSLYRAWSQLSMGFVKDSVCAIVVNSPTYLNAYASNVQLFCNAGPSKSSGAWANKMLLDASQFLQVFDTLSREISSPTGSDNLNGYNTVCEGQIESSKFYLIRWIVELAESRCKTLVEGGEEQSREAAEDSSQVGSRVEHKSYGNALLAVLFGVLALSRLAPFHLINSLTPPVISPESFRDTLKLITIVTTEATSKVVVLSDNQRERYQFSKSASFSDALALRVLRGAFPQLVLMLQALVEAFPLLTNPIGAEYMHTWCQLLKTVESLECFLVADYGLSLSSSGETKILQNLRSTLESCATIAYPPHSAQQEPPRLGSSAPVVVKVERSNAGNDITQSQNSYRFPDTSGPSLAEDHSLERYATTNSAPADIPSSRLFNTYADPTAASSNDSTCTSRNSIQHSTRPPTCFVSSESSPGMSSDPASAGGPTSQVAFAGNYALIPHDQLTNLENQMGNSEEAQQTKEPRGLPLESFTDQRREDEQTVGKIGSAWVQQTHPNSHQNEPYCFYDDNFDYKTVQLALRDGAEQEGQAMTSPPCYQQVPPYPFNHLSTPLPLDRGSIQNSTLPDLTNQTFNENPNNLVENNGQYENSQEDSRLNSNKNSCVFKYSGINQI